MSGSVVGGKKAAEKLKAKDPDFYRRIGALGGKARRQAPGGFGSEKVGADGLTGPERSRAVASHGAKMRWQGGNQ